MPDQPTEWTVAQLRGCRQRLERWEPPHDLDEFGLLYWYVARAATLAKAQGLSELSFANRARDEYRKAPGPAIDRMPGNHGVPPKMREALLARDGIACAFCGSADDPQADHVKPRARGGATTLDNLQVLCGPCNRKKGAAWDAAA